MALAAESKTQNRWGDSAPIATQQKRDMATENNSTAQKLNTNQQIRDMATELNIAAHECRAQLRNSTQTNYALKSATMPSAVSARTILYQECVYCRIVMYGSNMY